MLAAPAASRAASRPWPWNGSAVSSRPTPSRATATSAPAVASEIPTAIAIDSPARDAEHAGRRDHREHSHAHQREHDLRTSPYGEVRDHRRGRVGARDAAVREQPRAREVAADLRHRQQLVDRFADPAQPQHPPERRPRRARQQRVPAQRVERQREQCDTRDASMSGKPPPASTAPSGTERAENASAASNAPPTTPPASRARSDVFALATRAQYG